MCHIKENPLKVHWEKKNRNCICVRSRALKRFIGVENKLLKLGRCHLYRGLKVILDWWSMILLPWETSSAKLVKFSHIAMTLLSWQTILFWFKSHCKTASFLSAWQQYNILSNNCSQKYFAHSFTNSFAQWANKLIIAVKYLVHGAKYVKHI